MYIVGFTALCILDKINTLSYNEHVLEVVVGHKWYAVKPGLRFSEGIVVSIKLELWL